MTASAATLSLSQLTILATWCLANLKRYILGEGAGDGMSEEEEEEWEELEEEEEEDWEEEEF